MSYSLRPYQQKAVDFAIPRLRNGDKPLLMCLGTGAGKTWVISEIAKQWGEKVLVLTLSKELCEQDYEKMRIVAGEEGVGMYSASWGKKEVENITVATVQSAYRHPELWENYSLVIYDECDSSVDGMVASIIKGKKVLGLTATPFATHGSRSGKWFTTRLYPLHKIKTKLGWFWQPVEFCISEKDLLEQGYLCPMKIYSSPIECWRLKENSNGSEYTQASIVDWITEIYDRIVEVMQKAEETGMCHSGIVFMPSVESCNNLAKLAKQAGLGVGVVCAKTPPKERDKIIEAHKNGELTWLINQNVCVRGFDSPKVDCLVIGRPTRSLRLWRQALGRGLRIAEGKTICNVLDLTNNSKTWGGPEDIEISKNGWQDAILLKGHDISGMEISRIDLNSLRNQRNNKTEEKYAA